MASRRSRWMQTSSMATLTRVSRSSPCRRTRLRSIRLRMRWSDPARELHPYGCFYQPLEAHMLSWAIGFFIVAILAAIFGFTGLAGTAAGIAKVLFFLFLIAFVVSLVMAYPARAAPPLPPLYLT